MDGGVPGDLAGGAAAGADVVDGADVAAVEAEAGAEMEHAFVGWVGFREGEGGGRGGGVGNGEVREGGVEVIEGEREGPAGDGTGPFVVHACEADFRA